MNEEKKDLFGTLSEKDKLLLIVKSATLKVKYNSNINKSKNNIKKYTLNNKNNM